MNSFYEMFMEVTRSYGMGPNDIMQVAVAYSRNWGSKAECSLRRGRVHIRDIGYLNGREKKEVHDQLAQDIREGIGDCEIMTQWTCLDYLPFESYITQEREVEK